MLDVEEKKLGVQHLENNFVTLFVAGEAIEKTLGEQVFFW